MSRSVVVLPAPFGPSRPKTDAGRHVEVEARRRRARRTRPPNRLVSPRQATARAAHRLLAPHDQVEDRADQADEADDDPPHELAVAVHLALGLDQVVQGEDDQAELDDDDRGQSRSMESFMVASRVGLRSADTRDDRRSAPRRRLDHEGRIVATQAEQCHGWAGRVGRVRAACSASGRARDPLLDSAATRLDATRPDDPGGDTR